MSPLPAAATSGAQSPPTVSIALSIVLVIVIFLVVYYSNRIARLKRSLRANLPREQEPPQPRGITRQILKVLPIVKYDSGVATKHHGIGKIIRFQRPPPAPSSSPLGSDSPPAPRLQDGSSTKRSLAWVRRFGTSPEDKVMVGNIATSCVICAENFTHGESVRRLPCQHIFHPSCIDPWLLERATTCPLWQASLSSRNILPHSKPWVPLMTLLTSAVQYQSGGPASNVGVRRSCQASEGNVDAPESRVSISTDSQGR